MINCETCGKPLAGDRKTPAEADAEAGDLTPDSILTEMADLVWDFANGMHALNQTVPGSECRHTHSAS